jgi:hypothetical protein
MIPAEKQGPQQGHSLEQGEGSGAADKGVAWAGAHVELVFGWDSPH